MEPAILTTDGEATTWRAGRVAAAVLVVALAFAAGYAVRTGTAPALTSNAAPVGGHTDHGPGGLQVSQSGFTLDPLGTELSAGKAGEFAFRVLGATGEPVTRFVENHDKLMHLVLVRRDLTGFQHLHPEMDPDGVWRARVTLPAPGVYRAFADFQPEGAVQSVTLGVDVTAPGRYVPRPLPDEEPTLLVDGYAVTLDGGLRPGQASQILVWLGKDGLPVNDLQPHLGAYGHLVALRQGDLAYLHVHPAPAREPSSVVAFAVQAPSAGTYRMFFEFRHRDVVHTAEFTLRAG